jgi:hypothetical protein
MAPSLRCSCRLRQKLNRKPQGSGNPDIGGLELYPERSVMTDFAFYCYGAAVPLNDLLCQ